VQGDEPEIEPATIDALIERLQTSQDDMATAATVFSTSDDPANPNLVKVVMDQESRAIYFSRSPIPYHRDADPRRRRGRSEGEIDAFDAYHLHLGIYAYRRNFLLQFAAWEPTPLEKAEKLEQLRALEHGNSIFVLKISRAVHGIDTAEQYQAFVKRYKGVVRS
jgi:3-deoxy-manno-octulosonate cytidylyltransferase (CMP-KDO synthetase)